MCLLAIGTFVGFIHLGSENAQGTFVSGIVYDGSGGPWTMAGNPYIVVDNVTVPAGETLTIEPGVEVKFDGYYNITVYGTLTAVGTETMRIIITSNIPSPAPGDWRSIRVTSSGHIEIKYCNVSYSAFGIYLYPSSNNIISNNTLSYSRSGINVRDSSNNTIIHNNILNNDVGIEVHESSNNIIAYNNVSDNDIGISLHYSSNNTVTNNNFVNDGISISGDQLSHFNSHTIPDNNIVNGKPLYYYKNCGGITIDGIPVGELILANCTDFDVKNLQINNTDVGIEVAYSTNISISNNNLSSNNGAGIDLYSSSYNKIINNDISNDTWGIEITTSSNNNIIANNNILSNNWVGIGVSGNIGGSSPSNNNVITNNILSNNGIGIGIGGATNDNSLNNTVTGNNISNNMYGIFISYTSENKVIRNNISNNDCGVLIHFSTGNDITNNSISNGEYGLYFFEGANDNVITGNTVSNNDYGVYIYFYGPSNNRFYHNNFINNTNQACDDTNNANHWDNGYPSGGNYWSDFDEPGEGAYDDYKGPNQDDPTSGDGIVDVGIIGGGGRNPYVIDSDSQDNYPLINPLDNWPPTITNLQPPDGSATNDNTSTISADYSDPSGINVSSVVLKVDGSDMTSYAMVTPTNVTYPPGTALSEGVHTIYLEVKDNVNNLATATWSFTVDTLPPITTISPDNYTVKLGTLFSLTATDGVGGCGVNYTQYKIDDGQWVDYFAPFSIDGYGYHNITYRSADNLGNIENENTLSIYVPKAPITTLIIGTPQYGTTQRYVNYSTQFSFSVIDYSGTGYDTYYYVDTSSPILYIGPFTVSTEGTHTIYYYSTDNLGNIEDTKEFDIIVDNTPPITFIVIGDPNYVFEDTWVTSTTELTLNAIDGGLIPVGVNYTKYRIWNGTWSSWEIYQNEFTLGVNDGIRYVEFYSIDWLGHEESIQNVSYIVDNNPPVTTIIVGNPNYISADTWVTSTTEFTLSATEAGVGLNFTKYRIYNGGVWTSWATYTGSFLIGPNEGVSYVEFYSVDWLVNNGSIQNRSYLVDNTPPVTTISIGDPKYFSIDTWVTSTTEFTLSATEAGVGLNYTKYRIYNGGVWTPWATYTGSFLIGPNEGVSYVEFYSIDWLVNNESVQNRSYLVDNTPPITTISIGYPKYFSIDTWVTSNTIFTLSAADGGSTPVGVNCTKYRIWKGTWSDWNIYQNEFTLGANDGIRYIEFYSIDWLGHEEPIQNQSYIVDNAPPLTTISVGDPKYISADTWVTSNTEITLSAMDDGVGLNHTKYRILNGGTWTSWARCTGGFSLGPNEGISYVEFYSIDWLGNLEPIQNKSYIIDNTPPITNVLVGDPKYKDELSDIWNVTSNTIFTISGSDDGVDLDYIEYRIWKNGSWSEWYIYAEGFKLGSDNGTKYVEWLSVDRLGNKEMNHNETYFVDNIPPETNYLLLLEPDNTEARLTLIPSDIGSGADLTKYRIDSGDWVTYSDTFVINESGEHEIYFWSFDKLGNVEDPNEVSVLVVEPPTSTEQDKGEEETNYKPLIALIFSIILLLIGSYVSYKRPLKLKGEITKDRLLTWLIVVLPFVIAEIITGLVSLVTGLLSVPPLFGVGMIVDTVILVVGLVADGYIFKKEQKIEYESSEL